jgi:spore coat protein U-like protein
VAARHPRRGAARSLAWTGLVLACLGAGPLSALAATASASFLVTISVPTICQIQTTNLAFPMYTNAADFGTATITITCGLNVAYNVGLDAGNGYSGTVSNRSLTLGAGVQMGYGLFSDAAHSVNWGNTVGTDTVTGLGSGYAQVLTVYGQVFGGQIFAGTGVYTDTVIATVTY